MTKESNSILTSSLFIRMIMKLSSMMDGSLIYSTKKNSTSNKRTRVISYYSKSIIYKLLCMIGRGFKKGFEKIRVLSMHSIIIKSISSLLGTMKSKKMMSFNLFTISLIIGYFLTNVIFNILADYKLKYMVFFIIGLIGMNVFVYLYNKCKKTSFFIKLFNNLVSW